MAQSTTDALHEGEAEYQVAHFVNKDLVTVSYLADYIEAALGRRHYVMHALAAA